MHVLCLLLVNILLSIPFGASWGPDGHGAAALAARQRVKPETRRKLDVVFGENYDVKAVAVEADAFAHSEEGKWSASLHYIDVQQYKATEIVMSRDCPDDRCIVSAVANYTAIAMAETSVSPALIQALTMIHHLPPDAAQPEHAGYAADTGGNKIIVKVTFATHSMSSYSSESDDATDSEASSDCSSPDPRTQGEGIVNWLTAEASMMRDFEIARIVDAEPRKGKGTKEPALWSRSKRTRFLRQTVKERQSAQRACCTGDSCGAMVCGQVQNLHAVWDSTILKEYMTRHNLTVEELASHLAAVDPSVCSECDDDDLGCGFRTASESLYWAYTKANRDANGVAWLQSGDTLGEDYYQANHGVVLARLACSSVRMAKTFDQVLENKQF